jgi:hypothetical protein
MFYALFEVKCVKKSESVNNIRVTGGSEESSIDIKFPSCCYPHYLYDTLCVTQCPPPRMLCRKWCCQTFCIPVLFTDTGTLPVSMKPVKPSFTGVNDTSETPHMLLNSPRYSNTKFTQRFQWQWEKYQTYLILNLSGTESLWYWTYLVPIPSDTKHIRYRTYLFLSLSVSDPIWYWIHLIPNLPDINLWYQTNQISNLSDTKPIRYWTYQISNLSDTDHVRYQTYLIPNLSDTETIWYRTYQVTNLPDTKPIRYWTYLFLSLSVSDPI